MVSCLLYICDASNCERGSGNVIKESRAIDRFESLDVRGGVDVQLTQEPHKRAVIEAEDNILPYVVLESRGEELIVNMKLNNFVSHKGVTVYLSTLIVKSLKLSGSGDVRLANTFSLVNGMSFTVSGSGDVYGEVNAPRIRASITGSGNIEIRGQAEDTNVRIQGSGNFDGIKFSSKNADVSISGSGDAHLTVTKKLNVSIAGSGSVRYDGKPEVHSRISGSGQVKSSRK